MDQAEQSPDYIPNLVDKTFRAAVEYKAAYVRIKKSFKTDGMLPTGGSEIHPESGKRYNCFVVELVNSDTPIMSGSRTIGHSMEIADIPLRLWVPFISRLKVLARIVDYGPERSTNASIKVEIDTATSASFILSDNPDPFRDEVVLLGVNADVGA